MHPINKLRSMNIDSIEMNTINDMIEIEVQDGEKAALFIMHPDRVEYIGDRSKFATLERNYFRVLLEHKINIMLGEYD